MPAAFRRETVRSPTYENEDRHVDVQDENDKENEEWAKRVMI